MKPISKFGMAMAFPILIIQLIRVPLSLSPTTNPHSFKMMKGRPVETIKTANQLLDQKAMGNC